MLGRGFVQARTKMLYYCSRGLVKRRSWRRRIKGDDRISELPDDVLVKILSFLPTKKAVATSILSKQWRYVWTNLPRLVYSDFKREESIPEKSICWPFQKKKKKKSICWYVKQSLGLHKGTIFYLSIELGPRCPFYIDVGDLIALELCRVRELVFRLSWLSGPFTLPHSLYISDTLVRLDLFDKIVVDVPCSVCLPNLKTLALVCVYYKDEDSLVRLLSGCQILEELGLYRHSQDNLKNFTVIKVPSLKSFSYTYILKPSDFEQAGNMEGSLVIDSPALTKLFIVDGHTGSSCLIENKPRLDQASIINIAQYPDYEFKRSLSSVMFLELFLSPRMVFCCNSINFSQLIECIIVCPFGFNWLEPFMSFLENSPKLRVLQINQVRNSSRLENFQVSFKQPSSVPKCLSRHLEIFEWKECIGRNGEKEFIRYILANAMCLKRAGISINTKHRDKKKKMMEELKTMPRVSTSSQLLFSTHFKFMVSPYSER